MGKTYDAVIFDVDGTLLNTTEGVLNAAKYTMNHMKLPVPTEDILKSFIGPPIQDSFAKQYGLTGEILQEIATVFRNRYKDYELLKAKPYDGIFTVMDELGKAGIKIAIATYKREDYAQTLLKHFGFGQYTDIIHGGDHFNVLKKRDIIEICLKELNITDNKRAVMIGDSANDAIGAEGIGTEFIGVTYGFDFATYEDMAKFKAAGVAKTPMDLLSMLI